MLRLDFVDGTLGWRRRHGGGRGQAVAKAVGLRAGVPPPKVLDCTAGLGRDAFILATLGCQVLGLERNSVVASALIDALQRAQEDEVTAKAMGGRLSFLEADSLQVLPEFVSSFQPQVLFVDPMHPPRSKSALVKKEMRILREEVGVDADAEELLRLALRQGVPRVVVKMPRRADAWVKSPRHQIMGRSTRFDIFINTS
ncbi:MAG: class I SAM-dependent methyltransferase [Planctomycetota bacterium]|jgi:16S rRNA (guanine1516-N2)-methyltransferase|nr:class I SAM-dependent methyltransferase [Planctomycetota bacterium]